MALRSDQSHINKMQELAVSNTDTTIEIQRDPSYYAVLKAANTIGYFAATYFTYKCAMHEYDWQLSTVCVVVSACWLVLTRIKIDHLLQTFFDVLSRIEIFFPVTVGIGLSAIALFAHSHPLVHYCAIAEVFGWLGIYVRYRANKAKFEKAGHGPVPVGTWINPPAEAMRPGDLILTSGMIAKDLHESVGHAETVLRMQDGSMKLFSSYMDRGAFLHDLNTVTILKEHGDYVLLHLKKPWDEAQQNQSAQIAIDMIATNKQWAAEENKKLSAFVKVLPISESQKHWIEKVFHATGYDWFGTFMGRPSKNHWTCISGCLELYHRMGVKTNVYGTGLLGFGTTLFDPVMPVRFLSDPAFHLVLKSERQKPSAEY